MKKVLTVLLTAGAVAITGCGAKKLDAIKIGFMGPLTGDYANYGKLMTQAIQIAIDEKNAAGGIGGNKIVFLPEDDEGKVDKANAAIEKLAGVDNVLGIVGSVFSSCSLTAAPKAEASKIVMISPSSTHKDLPAKGNYIFRTIVGDDFQARVFAKYAANVAKVKTVAILYIKNDYSQGLAQDFKTEYEKLGGKVVAMETGVQNDKDFKTQLTKIKGTNPDALYIPNYVAEIAQILEQAKQLGLTCKIYSADGFSNPEIFKLAGKLTEGVIFSNSAEDKTNEASKKAFAAKYLARFGDEPDAFSLNSYDAANILIMAIEKNYHELSDADKKDLKLDREKIRGYVAATRDFPGVSGTITFTASGDLVKNMGIYVAEGGKYKQLAGYQIDDKDQLVEVK